MLCSSPTGLAIGGGRGAKIKIKIFKKVYLETSHRIRSTLENVKDN